MQNPLDQIQRFFEYDFWANEKILTALKSNPEIGRRALEIFSHIFGVQKLWYLRITGGEYNSQMVWPTKSLKECEDTLQQNNKLWLDYLQNLTLDDLPGKISYANSKGEFYKSSIYEVLMQVIMHGTYHRGQIAILLRQSDVQPPATDYIYYVRKK
jgi:uncharacterized damage-inducible protein DinB